jgi:hypothetical protein
MNWKAWREVLTVSFEVLARKKRRKPRKFSMRLAGLKRER